MSSAAVVIGALRVKFDLKMSPSRQKIIGFAIYVVVTLGRFHIIVGFD